MDYGSGVYLPGFDGASYPRYFRAQDTTILLKTHRFDVAPDFQKQRLRIGQRMRVDKLFVVEP